MNVPFEDPLFLLLIPLGLVAVFKLVRQKSRLGFSSAALLEGIGLNFPLLLLEKLFLSVFVIAGALILARPTQFVRDSVPVYQGARDISIVLDVSGSMVDERMKAATRVISEFVRLRPQDRIALVVFNTEAYLEWPLSSDHESLIFRLNQAKANGGTRIASGVIAGLNHQRRYGQNSGAVIVVSDGGSEVTPEEKSAIETALGQTKLYWIWIGRSDDQTARQFWLYITSLGGKVYQGEIREMDAIFSEINRLEASPVLWEQRVTAVNNFSLLPLAALTSLFLAGVVNLIREI